MSRVREWARWTRRRSRSCRGWRTLHGSPGSPCCCSACCIGTGEKKKSEENEGGKEGGREQRGRGRAQVEVPERQGFGDLKGGQITSSFMLHVCGTGACVTV